MSRAEIPEPPALVLSPNTYSQTHFDKSNNILRLFFNRLVSVVRQLLSREEGGRFIYFPMAQLVRNSDLGVAVADTPEAVPFNEEGVLKSIANESSTQLVFRHQGVYAVAVNAHVVATGASGTIVLWMRKNGTTVEGNAVTSEVTGEHLISPTFLVDVENGDYLELMYAATNSDIKFENTPAAGNYPQRNAIICSVLRASNN